MIKEIEIPENLDIDHLRKMISDGQINSKCKELFIGDFEEIENQNLPSLSRCSHRLRRVYVKNNKLFAKISILGTLCGKKLRSNLSNYKFVLRLNDKGTEFVTIDALSR